MGSAVENDAPESYGDHSAPMFHVKRALWHAERTRVFGGPRESNAIRPVECVPTSAPGRERGASWQCGDCSTRQRSLETPGQQAKHGQDVRG